MANRQRAEARRKAAAKAARGEGGGGRTAMWVTIAVIVVAAVVGIVIATTGGDDSPAASGSTETTQAGLAGLPDSQKVTVTGDALAPFDSAANPDPAVGKDAPVIEGLNFNGVAQTLDAKKNGAYMVVFLAHWCPHCNAEVPRLIEWKNSGAVPADLDIIGVATAVSKTSANYPPAQWFSTKGWPWPVLVDESQGDGAAGKAAEAMGATGWPYFVIVGADGKVKVRVSGEVEITDLQKIVDAALAA